MFGLLGLQDKSREKAAAALARSLSNGDFAGRSKEEKDSDSSDDSDDENNEQSKKVLFRLMSLSRSLYLTFVLARLCRTRARVRTA